MDTTTSQITFDEKGVCNYCRSFNEIAEKTIHRAEEIKSEELARAVEAVKKIGRNQEYDCILGLSGGVDSTYLAYLTSELGLRPLCVHFDNGWNSEIAVQNIHNIVNKLGFDLHTFVMDWDEFKDIQLSYFKASVLDLEVPTDQFIFAALYKIAKENGIRTILSGNNLATEFVLPFDWRYDKFDITNLKSIHAKYAKGRLRKLPKLGPIQRHWYEVALQIKDVKLLNLIAYKKLEVKKIISDKLGWKDYGGKHYESIFTRWYQGVYLPTKFSIDKRKAHLSNMILNGEITKDEALEELKNPTYDPSLQLEDNEYVAKKWGFSEAEFTKYMDLPPRDHRDFKTDKNFGYQIRFILFRLLTYLPIRCGRLLGLLPRQTL
ncbi:N-acetyl sugar amidotransferase [Ekhidna sp.]|uniref:N-acetyl sugar amidotransferase n=1 Tax=Ekhidna sp. TaxID=2608089 RepID=UPI003C7DCE1F